jgi:type IV secretory pathway VirB4 component
MAVASKPAQDFVPIQEVRDGIVVLRDGSLRSIVLASSVNFALKSADEQQAILLQFQDFLNSLDFSIQIFVESRRLDIRPYLAILENRYREETNDLFKIQIREYIEFIKGFTQNTNIMTKSFFIVVPYSPAFVDAKGGILSSLFGKGKKTPSSVKGSTRKSENFEEDRTQLEQRIGIVEQGLVRCGVRVIPLGSEEVIELFYKIFNPGETDKPVSLN